MNSSDSDYGSSDSDSSSDACSDVTIQSTDEEEYPASEAECDDIDASSFRNLASVILHSGFHLYKWNGRMLTLPHASERYGPTREVSLQLGGSDQIIVVPHEFLVTSFKYFRLALRENEGQSMFVEGNAGHTIFIEEVNAGAFTHLFNYLQHGETSAYEGQSSSIDLLLEAFITADYLNLDTPKLTFLKFEDEILQFTGI